MRTSRAFDRWLANSLTDGFGEQPNLTPTPSPPPHTPTPPPVGSVWLGDVEISNGSKNLDPSAMPPVRHDRRHGSLPPQVPPPHVSPTYGVSSALNSDPPNFMSLQQVHDWNRKEQAPPEHDKKRLNPSCKEDRQFYYNELAQKFVEWGGRKNKIQIAKDIFRETFGDRSMEEEKFSQVVNTVTKNMKKNYKNSEENFSLRTNKKRLPPNFYAELEKKITEKWDGRVKNNHLEAGDIAVQHYREMFGKSPSPDRNVRNIGRSIKKKSAKRGACKMGENKNIDLYMSPC